MQPILVGFERGQLPKNWKAIADEFVAFFAAYQAFRWLYIATDVIGAAAAVGSKIDS